MGPIARRSLSIERQLLSSDMAAMQFLFGSGANVKLSQPFQRHSIFLACGVMIESDFHVLHVLWLSGL